jgi:hypothetical protein
MVSSTSQSSQHQAVAARGFYPGLCNLNAAYRRPLIHIVLCCAIGVVAPRRAEAQQDVAAFLAGGAIAFAMHEAGHAAFDIAFDAPPGVKKVSFGFIPFFAITHSAVSPAREFSISSAGFWVQEGVNEVLLTRQPQLRRQHAPLLKGMFAFNVLASVAYASAAMGETGPGERDTRGIAASAGVSERWVGGVVLAPAVLDALRYYKPDTAWLRWASRASKAGGVLLLLKAR